MTTRLYVGNLSYSLRSADLEEEFGKIGEVVSAKVILERDTGRSKGFAFVEMGSEELAERAIEEMNGKELAGRPLKVTQANPRPDQTDRPPRNSSYGHRHQGDRRSGGYRKRGSEGGRGGFNSDF